MAKSRKSPHLLSLIQSVKDEWKGTYRKYPELTIMALRDEAVCAAIEKRFAAEAGIRDVTQLDYDFHSGLHHLVFEFEPSRTDLGARPNAFLVIADGAGKVIAVVDPFDPVQPNKFVPPLPRETEQPFVLARPSATPEVSPSDDDMYPLQVRSRSFFERLKGGGVGVMPDDFTINTTKCSYTTQTPGDYWTDWNNDDCAAEDAILT